MCAIPLRIRTDVIGALNLFRGSDEQFTATEMEIAQSLERFESGGFLVELGARGQSAQPARREYQAGGGDRRAHGEQGARPAR